MHTQSQLIEHSSRGTLGICNVCGGDLWHAQDSPNATLQTKATALVAFAHPDPASPRLNYFASSLA